MITNNESAMRAGIIYLTNWPALNTRIVFLLINPNISDKKQSGTMQKIMATASTVKPVLKIYPHNSFRLDPYD